MIVRTLNKKKLYYLFDLVSHSGHYNIRGFYNLFNDDVITNILGMDVAEFKKVRTFNYAISQKIIDYFNITQEELQESGS